MKIDRWVALVGGAALVTLIAASLIVVWPRADRFAACRASAVAGGSAAIGGPFTLVDEDGRTVTDKDVITRPTLIYFGYSYCPDVCPLDEARNAEAVAELQDQGKNVGNVFVSIDPERDTPEVMKEFTDYFAPDLLGLTGSDEQVAQAAGAYRVLYRKQPGSDADDYLMSHTTFTYLMFPDAGMVEFFDRDVSAEDMARRVGCFVDAA
jgi:protein SCO1/2